MEDTQKENILKEIKNEQHPLENEDTLKGYIEEANYDIIDNVGQKIDYDKNLKARSLLKNYVFYARYKRLAEFKQLYVGWYAELQAEYYKPPGV